MPAPRNNHFELMLDLFMIQRDPARCYSQNDIAAFMGCDRSHIARIEASALRKLHIAADLIGLDLAA